MSKKYKVIDLFAGIWWLSYGFYHSNDFEVVAANEILPDMCKTYRLNHPWVNVYEMDIANFNIDLVKQQQWINQWDIDIIIWWPPCQAYSTVWKRLLDDPRWKLFQEYYRILKEFSPTMFIYENVKWLLSMKWGELIKNITELFGSLWYFVKFKVINVANYWVPQLRERVIMVGSKIDWNFEYPSETHNEKWLNWLEKRVTLEEAIWDLPQIDSWWKASNYENDPYTEYQKTIRNNNKTLYDHEAPKNWDHLLELMKHIPEWWSPENAPEHLRPKSWFWNTYCRLRNDRPWMTITRNLWTPSSSRCIHPTQDRPLSTREGARIQSFPDTFRFAWSRSSKNLQLWNAVPPILSKHLSKSVLKYLQQIT